MKTIRILTLGAAVAALASCSNKPVTITVTNPGQAGRHSATVEVDAADLAARAGAQYVYIVDAEGNEVPSQLTYDGKLIFQADLGAGESETFTACPSDTARVYDPVAVGRPYPERADDVAWENEVVGYRAYGPTTQGRGERAFGYDIFFKHKNLKPVLEEIYATELDPVKRQQRDSIRAIDPAAAEEFIKTFSYHVDHGLGMDCYAVGPTLGAGCAVPVANDSLSFSWCYDKAAVLDNGPLRFTVELVFAPREVAGDTVTERRVISLDKGSYLNRTVVDFSGLAADKEIAAGFPLRDDSPAVAEEANGTIVYADPTNDKDSGRAMLGIVLPGGFSRTGTSEGHILGYRPLGNAPYEYFWGYAWDREDIKDLQQWKNYVDAFAAGQAAPLQVEVK